MGKEVTIEEIQKIICKHFNIGLGELKSKRRSRNIALPRHLAMYLCRKHTAAPSSFIGFKFGGRDHSTVLHALKNIKKKLKQDPWVLASILTLEKDLQAGKLPRPIR